MSENQQWYFCYYVIQWVLWFNANNLKQHISIPIVACSGFSALEDLVVKIIMPSWGVVFRRPDQSLTFIIVEFLFFYFFFKSPNIAFFFFIF